MPSNLVEGQRSRQYLQAWDEIGQLLAQGRSWSGRERNNCLLNTQGERFAEVAAVAGLDQMADSRGIAVADWDQDGDLDLWVTNRDGPRLRFLQNRAARSTTSVQFRLQGTQSNRDAIGARVELFLADAASPSHAARHVRYVTAGTGYLAQSSKWVHFGLPAEAEIDRVEVSWPGQSTEVFRGVQRNQRYELVQGRGHVRLHPTRPSVRLPRRPVAQAVPTPASVRLLPHARLPLPALPWINAQLRPQADPLEELDRPVLLVLWAGWCQPCLHELDQLQRRAAELAAAGVEVIPLNVEDLDRQPDERLAAAQQTLRQQGVTWPTRLATRAAVAALDAVRQALTDRRDELVLPSSVLVDRQGRLLVLYTGPVDVTTVCQDAQSLPQTGEKAWRDRAVPFRGSWFVNPLPADRQDIASRLLDADEASAAYWYLQRHLRPAMQANDPRARHVDRAALADLYHRIGIAVGQQPDAARDALHYAVQLQPESLTIRAALAHLLTQQQRIAEAAQQYEQILKRRPDHPIAANNLAWILATTDDAQLADPERAVALAEQVCQQTQYRLPSALDTLAAALAATGRWSEAAQMARQALQLLETDGSEGRAEALRRRLEDYQQQSTSAQP